MCAFVRDSLFSAWARKAGLFFKSIAVGAVALAGCSSSDQSSNRGSDSYDSKWGVSSSPRLAQDGPIPKGGGYYKVGSPYQIGGRWYTPQHNPNYNQAGVASWYGPGFHGRKTANGEIFDQYALTAAHKTLPMPSYAYVTNLNNGRTLLVRINDRGPYVGDREIDLSKAAADALGYGGAGLVHVRVRYAGEAPLNGDDRRERQYFANLQRGGLPEQRFAAAPQLLPATRNWPSAPSRGWPDAYVPQQRPVAPPPQHYQQQQQGWSPFAYRASTIPGQRSGLGGPEK